MKNAMKAPVIVAVVMVLLGVTATVGVLNDLGVLPDLTPPDRWQRFEQADIPLPNVIANFLPRDG